MQHAENMMEIVSHAISRMLKFVDNADSFI